VGKCDFDRQFLIGACHSKVKIQIYNPDLYEKIKSLQSIYIECTKSMLNFNYLLLHTPYIWCCVIVHSVIWWGENIRAVWKLWNISHETKKFVIWLSMNIIWLYFVLITWAWTGQLNEMTFNLQLHLAGQPG
jgi:hypothetical protein